MLQHCSIMLQLCSNAFGFYYAQNYASQGLTLSPCAKYNNIIIVVSFDCVCMLHHVDGPINLHLDSPQVCKE